VFVRGVVTSAGDDEARRVFLNCEMLVERDLCEMVKMEWKPSSSTQASRIALMKIGNKIREGWKDTSCFMWQ
jgi:hypothetical protein